MACGVGLASLAWLGGCSDRTGPPPPPPELTQGVDPGAVVSNPSPNVPSASAHRQGGGASFAVVDAATESDVVYVSLAEGTYPNGVTGIIKSPRPPGSITATMVNGGLDPVPIPAVVGDTLDLEILDARGVTLASERHSVPDRRRPKVIRTVPPRGKTDVAINASIVVVFSEPISAATLSASSVQLSRGGNAVPGTVRLLDGSGTIAVFDPVELLAPNTVYQLRVTQAVRDLQGDELEAEVATDFTTGRTSTGPPASIRIAPDTVYLSGVTFPETYQMTATVRDAAGHVLVEELVTWASNSDSLTVSGTGRVTIFAAGDYLVTASAGQLTARAALYVRGVPASVAVSPSPVSVAAEETIVLVATVRDASGFVLDAPVIWTSSAPSVASVASVPLGAMLATVTGVTAGNATITATSGAARQTTPVTVGPRRAIASVSVSPAAATLIVGETRGLSATPQDAAGSAIVNRPITWASDNPAVARVDANGQVTSVGVGTARVTATSEGVSGTATVTVTTLNFASVSAGDFHTCGLTVQGAVYCWGALLNFEIGIDPYSSRPVAIRGGVGFAAIAAGAFHTCGLKFDGAAYCWGSAVLGDGTDNPSATPVAVAGGLSFSSLTAAYHTCGLAVSGAAYCWGRNDRGHLGDGSTTTRLVPTGVAGGLTFESLTAGSYEHTCGLAQNGDAYCWGRNGQGELGDGSRLDSHVPTRVALAPFVSVVAGGYHTCGLAPRGDAYCWGTALVLGNSAGSASPVPLLVEGGLTFITLSAGISHTCGLVTDGSVYCWGRNDDGQLGDGTTSDRLLPTRVSGEIRFSSISAGGWHTCARTTDGIVYCWGLNTVAQLGIGSLTNSTVPVKVLGQP
jgi:alpha-tubulin suppressor-like RCC1 family protein